MAMYEGDKARQFLMGLNDDLYSTIKSQILALNPLPPLEKFSTLHNKKKIITKS